MIMSQLLFLKLQLNVTIHLCFPYIFNHICGKMEEKATFYYEERSTERCTGILSSRLFLPLLLVYGLSTT